MFAAGRILRQNRRLSSLPAGGVPPARPKKEKRKFRCYLPFMWSALGMSFLGISIIVTGTAMCVAGWYLGHFADYDSGPEVRVTSSNGSDGVSEDGSPIVEQITVSILPAKGLAYAGPVVMSFGCFAVVFACVVVCETRDRILETMESRVRRGLPARPPGGIDADFYALVVEFRKRRAEKQRRRRKLIQRDGGDDDDVDGAMPPEPPDTGRPSTPLITSPDLQTPSTINFFVEDHSCCADGADAFDDERHQPHRLSLNPDPSEMMADTAMESSSEDPTPRWCLTPSVPDYLRFAAADLELRPMDRSSFVSQSVSECGVDYSDSAVKEYPPKLPLCRTSSVTSGTSTSASNVELSGRTATLPPTVGSSLQVPQQPEVDLRRSSAAHAQSPFPLLAPIASLAETPASLPYVRLEPSAQSSTLLPPTSFVHTASVHAIADRSPDIVVTSFEFPPPADFLSSSDATAATSGCALNSGTDASGKSSQPHQVVEIDGRTSGEDNKVGPEHPCCIQISVSPQNAELTSSSRSTESSVPIIWAPTDVGYAAKRRPWSSADNTSLHVPSGGPWSADDKLLEQPSLSTTSAAATAGDDCGPSRKRSRGSKVGDSHPTPEPCVYQHLSGHDRTRQTSPSPLLLSPSCYLISASAASVECEPIGARSSTVGTAAAMPRRRRPNGTVRQALTTRHRRRRPRLDRDSTSGPQNSQMPGSEDEQHGGRRLSATEHHSADELDTLLVRDHARTSTTQGDDDDASRLIWLRRRTSPTSSDQRRTGDPFQSTV